MLWRDGEAPRLIQGRTVRELLQKLSVFGKDVNKATGSARGAGERDIDETAEVLNTEGSEARGNCGVSKRFYQLECAVIDVHFVVRVVISKQNIPVRLSR